MKKLMFLIMFLFLATNAQAGLITIKVLSEDTSIDDVNSNFSTQKNEFNGNIEAINMLDDTLDESTMADEINPRVRWDEAFSDFTFTGMLPATSGSLTSDISAGTSYVEGFRVVTSTTGNTYTASKDTWVFIDINETFQFSEVANGAAQPTTPSNSLLLAKVVTDGTTISSVDDKRSLFLTLSTVEDFYIKGLILLSADQTGVSVDSGVVYHGTTRIEKIVETELSIATATDWHDGAIDVFTNDGWCYVGIDVDGNIKLLGDNPPDTINTNGDQAPNTSADSSAIYWNNGGTFWRVLTEVKISSDTTLVYPAMQVNDVVSFTSTPQNITTTVSDGWSIKTSCQAGMPKTSRMALFGVSVEEQSGAEIMGVWIRPNGTDTLAIPTNAIIYSSHNQTGGPTLGAQGWSMTDNIQQIQYANDDTGADSSTRIDILSYKSTLRD